MGLDYMIYKVKAKISQSDLVNALRFTDEFIETINEGHTSLDIVNAYYLPTYVENLSDEEIEDIAVDLKSKFSRFEDKYPYLYSNYKDIENEVISFRNWYTLYYETKYLFQQHTKDTSFDLYGKQVLTKEFLLEFIKANENSKEEKDIKGIKALRELVENTDFENETLYAMAWG